MKSKYAKAWVRALRSGSYEQCMEQLTDGKGHCCLGVLCEVVGLKPSQGQFGLCYDGSNKSLPLSVLKLVGMHDEYGTVDKCCTALSELNDRGYSFEYIADVIEADWKSL